MTEWNCRRQATKSTAKINGSRQNQWLAIGRREQWTSNTGENSNGSSCEFVVIVERTTATTEVLQAVMYYSRKKGLFEPYPFFCKIIHGMDKLKAINWNPNIGCQFAIYYFKVKSAQSSTGYDYTAQSLQINNHLQPYTDTETDLLQS